MKIDNLLRVASMAVCAATLGLCPVRGAEALFVDASAGLLVGHFDAFHGGSPDTRYARELKGFSPSVGIGYWVTPHLALEVGYDGYGTYDFDNVYAFPEGSFTEYTQNRLDERLAAVSTRLAWKFELPEKCYLMIAPGIEYQMLRQTVTYEQAYTIPFSLAQIVPDPVSKSYRFWRPDLDASLSCPLAKRLSLSLGYRLILSPGKTLSRFSGGLDVQL